MKKITKISSDKPKQNAKKLRVAAYCRVSTDNDAQLESLEAQKNHYEDYISNREDWTFAGLYFDKGITGTKKEKRPELLRMIADCKAGKIDFVVTKSISRFARNTTDCLELVRKLLELDIPIYFEKENLNTSAMESELFLSILSSMAEGESSSISERHLHNTSATVKIKRVTQKEFPAKMVVATQTRRRETPMSHYQHLTISERESIWENKLAGKSLREIARQTGRSVSTISRELKRNGTSQKYRPSEAQKKYERRRKRCRRKKLLQEGELKDLVVRLLTQQQWSPEQIAQRIELERGKKLVSYATIYRALHKGLMEAKGTRKNRHGRYPMEKHLRRKGWRGKGKGQKSRHFVHQTIEERPEEANRRSEIGHWEGDLVYSSFYKLYVVTLVDRKSRFLLTGISYSRKAQEVSDVICRLLKELPEKHVRSLTLDRGSEFSEHDQITKAFPSLQIYFAHPMSPWERGSNEQINGLLRQYIPKNTYQVPFSAERLAEFTEKLNHRPRKCLNWNSPSEIFSNLLLHLT